MACDNREFKQEHTLRGEAWALAYKTEPFCSLTGEPCTGEEEFCHEECLTSDAPIVKHDDDDYLDSDVH